MDRYPHPSPPHPHPQLLASEIKQTSLSTNLAYLLAFEQQATRPLLCWYKSCSIFKLCSRWGISNNFCALGRQFLMASYVSALVICPILAVEGRLCTVQTWKTISSFRSKYKHVSFFSNVTHGVADTLCLFSVSSCGNYGSETSLSLSLPLSLSLSLSLSHTHTHTLLGLQLLLLL